MGFDSSIHSGYYVVQGVCGTVVLGLLVLHAVLFWNEPACLALRGRCCRVRRPVSAGRLHAYLRFIGLFNCLVFLVYW